MSTVECVYSICIFTGNRVIYSFIIFVNQFDFSLRFLDYIPTSYLKRFEVYTLNSLNIFLQFLI